MNQDQCIGQAKTRLIAARRLVTNDEPGGAREPLVEHLCDDANVGVYVGGDNEGMVDIGDPEFRQSSIKRRKQEGDEVEEDGSSVSGY